MTAPKDSPYLLNVFRRQPVMFVRGQGPYLWDADGKKYLDFFSGLAMCGLGHAHSRVAAAAARQMRTLTHTSNLYHTQPQRDLAEQLMRRTFDGRVFFSNSGAEANELAIKIARRYGARRPKQGKARYEVVVFENAFHGRTLGALAATPQKKYQKDFGPMLAGFPVARLGDLASVRKKIGPRTCAILVEPVQGEGGIHTAPAAFFQGLKALCRKHDLLLMFDEVQTGVGRTGQLFAFQTLGVAPDVLTAAKGLANGLPLGATLARRPVADLLGPGDHGSTFSGGPVVCAAALEVLRLLTPKALARARALSKLFHEELRSWQGELPLIREVRGLGLMLGIELDRPGAEAVRLCRERGLIVNCTAERVIRLLPPLVLSEGQARQGLKILKMALRCLSDRTAR